LVILFWSTADGKRNEIFNFVKVSLRYPPVDPKNAVSVPLYQKAVIFRMRPIMRRRRFRGLCEVLETRVAPATFLPAVADYDGDGRADLGALRISLDPKSTGAGGSSYYLTDQTSAGPFGEVLGIAGNKGTAGEDVPVPLDLDRDGKADFAVYGPNGPNGNGRFLIIPSTGNRSQTLDINLGQPLDVPAIGDFDGQGRDEIAVFGPYGPGGTGRFLWVSSSDAVTHKVDFGNATDVPAIADYDGDGKADFAVYGPDGHGGMRLLYLPSRGGAPVSIEIGEAGDVPVPADYDGSGKAEPAVFGPAGGGGMRFLILPSNGGPPVITMMGAVGTLPAPADYLGNGRVQAAVFLPQTATFLVHEPAGNVVLSLNQDVIPVERPDDLGPLAQPFDGPYASPLEMHQNFANRGQSPDVVFLGDSITDYLGETAGPDYPARSIATDTNDVGSALWSSRISSEFGLSYNFGIQSDSVQNVLWRVENGEIGGKILPKVVVLFIGINDLKFYDQTPHDVATTISAIVAVIHQRSPSTKVLLLDLLPSGGPNDPVRSRIDELNALISGTSTQPGIAPLYVPGVTVGNLQGDHSLNLDSLFLNPDKTINTQLIQYAGGLLLHPTALGYQVWLDAINTPLRKMLGLPDTPDDFFGDGVSDFTLYDRTTGLWTILDPRTGAITRVQTMPNMIPVPADYDGDGITDLALFDPNSRPTMYYIWKSNGSPISTRTRLSSAFAWGNSTIIPTPADFDGDGKADLAGFDPAGPVPRYYISYSSGHAPPGLPGTSFAWGGLSTEPLPGDYDGDGRADVAGFDPASNLPGETSTFYILYAKGGVFSAPWGGASLRPAPGDYFGDGRLDIAGYDPTTTPSTFYIADLNGRARVVPGFGSGNPKLIPTNRSDNGVSPISVYEPNVGWIETLPSGQVEAMPESVLVGSGNRDLEIPVDMSPSEVVQIYRQAKAV
jgi:lysophospholipase L1-like esterase